VSRPPSVLHRAPSLDDGVAVVNHADRDADLLSEDDAERLAYEVLNDRAATPRELTLARLVQIYLSELEAERAGEDL
jgi:hypothetical protein